MLGVIPVTVRLADEAGAVGASDSLEAPVAFVPLTRSSSGRGGSGASEVVFEFSKSAAILALSLASFSALISSGTKSLSVRLIPSLEAKGVELLLETLPVRAEAEVRAGRVFSLLLLLVEVIEFTEFLLEADVNTLALSKEFAAN